jgi:O-antigen/teichoic acid export membrane protein
MVLRQGGIIAAFSILSRTLEPDAYGQFQRAWMIGLAVAATMALGIPQSMQYFIPRLRSLPLRRRAFLQSMTLLEVGGLGGALLVYFLAEPLSYLFCRDVTLAPVLRRYCFVVPFLAFGAQASALFTSIERPRLAGIMNGLYGLAMVASLGGMVIFSKRLEHLFAAQAGALGAVVLAGTVTGALWVRQLTGGESPGAELAQAPEQRPTVRRQFAYALPLVGMAIVGAASILIAKYVVSSSARYSAGDFAVFANGAVPIPIASILVAAVVSVVQPHLTRACQARNIDRAVDLVRQTSGNIAMIVFPSAVFLAIFGRDVMIVLFGQRYAASGWIFMLFSVGMLPRIYSPFSVISATGKTRLVLYISLTSLVVNFVACWLGIRLYGMIGVAIGTISHRLLVQMLFAWVAARALGTSFARVLPWRHLGRTLVACAAAGVVVGGSLLLPLPSIVRLVLAAAVYAPVYLLVARKSGAITPAHTELLRSALAKYSKK